MLTLTKDQTHFNVKLGEDVIAKHDIDSTAHHVTRVLECWVKLHNAVIKNDRASFNIALSQLHPNKKVQS